MKDKTYNFLDEATLHNSLVQCRRHFISRMLLPWRAPKDGTLTLPMHASLVYDSGARTRRPASHALQGAERIRAVPEHKQVPVDQLAGGPRARQQRACFRHHPQNACDRTSHLVGHRRRLGARLSASRRMRLGTLRSGRRAGCSAAHRWAWLRLRRALPDLRATSVLDASRLRLLARGTTSAAGRGAHVQLAVHAEQLALAAAHQRRLAPARHQKLVLLSCYVTRSVTEALAHAAAQLPYMQLKVASAHNKQPYQTASSWCPGSRSAACAAGGCVLTAGSGRW